MNEKLQAAVIQALESVQKGMPGYWQQLVAENADKNLCLGCLFSILSLLLLILSILLVKSIYNNRQHELYELIGIIKIFVSGFADAGCIIALITAINHISNYYAPNIALIEIIKSK